MGEYDVETEDIGIIRAVLAGIQLKKDVDAVMAQTTALVQNSGVGSILIDIRNIEDISGGARRALTQHIASEPRFYKKLAILGEKAKHRVMANFMITASGEGNNVRYFESKEEALLWLKE